MAPARDADMRINDPPPRSILIVIIFCAYTPISRAGTNSSSAHGPHYRSHRRSRHRNARGQPASDGAPGVRSRPRAGLHAHGPHAAFARARSKSAAGAASIISGAAGSFVAGISSLAHSGSFWRTLRGVSARSRSSDGLARRPRIQCGTGGLLAASDRFQRHGRTGSIGVPHRNPSL